MLYVSSTLGIVAVGVGLLMIGGEFDLSAGVAAISAGLTAAMVSFELNLNVVVGALLSLVLLLVIGFINGYLVVKTGIPSFLVTLSTFFILQGVNLGVTKLVTGAVATPTINDMDGFPLLHAIFDTGWQLGSITVRITVLWWFLFVAIATWILLRTKIGNWIFACGRQRRERAGGRRSGEQVKIGLFMGVAFLAWFYGMHNLFAYNTVQAGGGIGQEFLYIIAAVVGGTLLTGGYGTAIGSAIGAFIFGMTQSGIVYAAGTRTGSGTFLGVMLLLAVLV